MSSQQRAMAQLGREEQFRQRMYLTTPMRGSWPPRLPEHQSISRTIHQTREQFLAWREANP